MAIKLECVKTNHPQLHIEAKFYKMMQSGGESSLRLVSCGLTCTQLCVHYPSLCVLCNSLFVHLPSPLSILSLRRSCLLLPLSLLFFFFFFPTSFFPLSSSAFLPTSQYLQHAHWLMILSNYFLPPLPAFSGNPVHQVVWDGRGLQCSGDGTPRSQSGGPLQLLQSEVLSQNSLTARRPAGTTSCSFHTQ